MESALDASEPVDVGQVGPVFCGLLSEPLPCIWDALSQEQKGDLEAMIDPANLKCALEPNSAFEYRPGSAPPDCLATMKVCREISKEKSQENAINPAKGRMENFGGSALTADDVIVTFTISNIRNGMRQQDIEVLGSQSLCAVRDMIGCVNDKTDFSVNSESAFFFIEGAFYNDTRHRSAPDYSREVIQFLAKNNTPDTPPPLSLCMEATRLDSLRLCLGYPYVYVHQGDCQHIVTATRIRVPHCTDIQYRAAYPVLSYRRRLRPEICSICEIFPACYVTYNDGRALQVPSFYCDHCYGPLHTDITGVATNCTTYPYPGPS